MDADVAPLPGESDEEWVRRVMGGFALNNTPPPGYRVEGPIRSDAHEVHNLPQRVQGSGDTGTYYDEFIGKLLERGNEPLPMPQGYVTEGPLRGDLLGAQAHVYSGSPAIQWKPTTPGVTGMEFGKLPSDVRLLDFMYSRGRRRT